jgi:TatD DNase family protein
MMFIDSHAHIDGPEFDADREEVSNARRLRASRRSSTSARAIRTAARSNAPLSGPKHDEHLHRYRHASSRRSPLRRRAEEKIKTLIRTNDVIAWGEIGLDFHYDNSPRDVQVEVFKRQLRAARECDLPVISTRAKRS